jgi:hypothetical protein
VQQGEVVGTEITMPAWLNDQAGTEIAFGSGGIFQLLENWVVAGNDEQD